LFYVDAPPADAQAIPANSSPFVYATRHLPLAVPLLALRYLRSVSHYARRVPPGQTRTWVPSRAASLPGLLNRSSLPAALPGDSRIYSLSAAFLLFVVASHHTTATTGSAAGATAALPAFAELEFVDRNS